MGGANNNLGLHISVGLQILEHLFFHSVTHYMHLHRVKDTIGKTLPQFLTRQYFMSQGPALSLNKNLLCSLRISRT